MKKPKTTDEGPSALDMFGTSNDERFTRAWELARASGRRCLALQEQLREIRQEYAEDAAHIAGMLDDAENQVRELEAELSAQGNVQLVENLELKGFSLPVIWRTLWQAGLLDASSEDSVEEVARSLAELLDSLPGRRGI